MAGERNGDRTLEVVQPLDLASDPLPWNGRPVPTVEAVDESRARDADITATVLAWTGVGASVAALGASLYWASIDDDCRSPGYVIASGSADLIANQLGRPDRSQLGRPDRGA